MLLRSWAPARGGVHSSACESGECNQGLRRVARRCRCRQAEMGELTSELMCGTSDGNVRYEARRRRPPTRPGAAERVLFVGSLHANLLRA